MEPLRRTNPATVTDWLVAAGNGDAGAWDRVASWAYDELELLAARRLRRCSAEALTLEPAALVNETFVKLIRHPTVLANRRHFFGYMSTVMMRVLLDYRRDRRADKRGAGAVQVTLDSLWLDHARSLGSSSPPVQAIDVLALHQAFERLMRLDRRKAEVARLRTLWGLTAAEIAEVLQVSEPTVRRDWRFSRAWLAEFLTGDGRPNQRSETVT